jgi:Cd2+/Zn2+-exporting ATPase
MDCAEEVEALKGTVGRLPGVSALRFNLLNATLSVVAEASVSEASLHEAVRRAGLEATPVQEHGAATDETFWQRWSRTFLCVGSGLLLLTGFISNVLAHGGIRALFAAPQSPSGSIPVLPWMLYLGAVVLGGWHVVPKAAASLCSLRPDMNLLMTLAVLGAGTIGEWSEAATVSFLFTLALVLESWSIGRARHAIQALMQLTPTRARCRSPAGEDAQDRPVADVPPGTTVLVHPGERIPLDGILLEGRTTVNEAPITGESLPVSKQPGDTVLAGTINHEGAVSLRVTKPASDTTLARIIRMVEEAQSRRAPVEQWVDRFARYYTPAMLLIALLMALVPPLLVDGDWARWFYRALVTLVIACPCALVISTPVGIIAGLTAAARNGVLIKGGVHLEMAARLNAIAIDKTGTLTYGEPEVQTIVALDEHSPDEILSRAAALESASRHPIARAICRKAAACGLSTRAVTDLQSVVGKGAEGKIEGQPWWIGSHRFMHEQADETPATHAAAENLEDAGHSVVILGSGRNVSGLIGVSDRLRDSAAAAITDLHRAGIRRIVMLTGDNEGTAKAIASAAGLDAYHAELLPEDKMRLVHALVQEYRYAGMVGDGVNDAPAMAACSLAVAMGAAGSDVAIEAADVALMTDDLSKLPWLIAHARRTLSTIRMNAFFALGLKAAMMILALGDMTTLWMAIAADTGASLLVVLWSLRLLKT